MEKHDVCPNCVWTPEDKQRWCLGAGVDDASAKAESRFTLPQPFWSFQALVRPEDVYLHWGGTVFFTQSIGSNDKFYQLRAFLHIKLTIIAHISLSVK